MSVKTILDSMEYGPAAESDAAARDWLARHQALFGHFINGEFTVHGDIPLTIPICTFIEEELKFISGPRAQPRDVHQHGVRGPLPANVLHDEREAVRGRLVVPGEAWRRRPVIDRIKNYRRAR